MARSKKTRALRDVAASILKRADVDGKRFGALSVNAWRDVVGDDVAQHTRGFALRQKRELVVYVDNAAWANQLSLMSTDLLARLNTHLGETAVRSLRFTVSRKVSDEIQWEMASRVTEDYYLPELATPAQLDEIELSQAAQVAAVVKNPDLREVALKAMVKDLEQKKGARAKGDRKGPGKPL